MLKYKYEYANLSQRIWEKKFAILPVKLGMPGCGSGTKVGMQTVYRRFVDGRESNIYEHQIGPVIKEAYDNVEFFRKAATKYPNFEYVGFSRSTWDLYKSKDRDRISEVADIFWSKIGYGHDYYEWVQRCIYSSKGFNV